MQGPLSWAIKSKSRKMNRDNVLVSLKEGSWVVGDDYIVLSTGELINDILATKTSRVNQGRKL